MRKVVYVAFILACTIILIGKILNWFIDFDPSFSNGLNLAMFTLLGIYWLYQAWSYDHKLIKALFFIGGIYLLLLKWINIPDFLSGVFIGLVLAPWILVKLNPKKFT